MPRIRPAADPPPRGPAARPRARPAGRRRGRGRRARARRGARAAVLAPLTGIFYASPSPGSPPFVEVGGEVVVGQVIGLIEAMKLFNEIKSRPGRPGRPGRRRRTATLVKAKQPLIEVEPL